MRRNAEILEVNPVETADKTKQIITGELKRDFEEWMSASEDLMLRPRIEMTDDGNQFFAKVLVSGMDSKSVQILVDPDRLLIKGEMYRKSGRRKFLSSANFPRPIDPRRVHAEINDGVLALRAAIAEAKLMEYVPRAA